MATPIFKFQHPELPNQDLYFIQNTFYELPLTIPMDLTSFVIYHFLTNRTLEGLFYCWDNLNNTGASMNGIDFETWFNEDEKSKLKEDALASNSLQTAIVNKTISFKINSFIEEKRFENEDFETFVKEEAVLAMKHFRPIEYYQSRHFLYDYIQSLSNNQEEDEEEDNESDDLGFDIEAMDPFDETEIDFDTLFDIDSNNDSNKNENPKIIAEYTESEKETIDSIFDSLFEEDEINLEDIAIDNFDQEEILIKLFINKSLPLHLIPHKYRTSGFFKDEFIRNDMTNLLPD
jgi:hypothetical protein